MSFPSFLPNSCPNLCLVLWTPPLVPPRHHRTFRRADPQLAFAPTFGPLWLSFFGFVVIFVPTKISSKIRRPKRPPEITKKWTKADLLFILGAILAPFLFHFSCFFTRVVNREKAIKTNVFSMILPFWELTFRIKFWSTFHVFSGSVFGASFFIFFQDFMPKRMILGPLWKPAGAKMAPKIRQMASKWHPFLKGALACARSCSRLASNIGFGPLLVSILAIFSWFYINLNEIWMELNSILVILDRSRH